MEALIKLAKQKVNEKLKDYPERLKHVYGVAFTASSLAKIYGVDCDKMMIAGLYHDYAKYDIPTPDFLSEEEKKIVLRFPVMFHAYQAAYLVQHELGIDDTDIINSIKLHVWGKPNMSVFEKILFISDYCEPNREFLDINDIFLMATKDLDKAVVRCMEISINHLLTKNLKPSSLQIEAYQYYMEETSE